MFWLRYQDLLAIASYSLVMCLIAFTIPPDVSILILRLWDTEIERYAEPIHALLVAVLGLLEPLRLKTASKYRRFEMPDFFFVQLHHIFQSANWFFVQVPNWIR